MSDLIQKTELTNLIDISSTMPILESKGVTRNKLRVELDIYQMTLKRHIEHGDLVAENGDVYRKVSDNFPVEKLKEFVKTI